MDASLLSFVRRADSDYSLYPFDPVKPLPWLFFAIILICGIVQYYQNLLRYKWVLYGVNMTMASTIWCAGFTLLGLSEAKPRSIALYATQHTLIFIAPPMYGAAETFILGRLMAYLPYHASLHPGRVVSTFVILSSVAAVIAALGASRTSNPVGHPEFVPLGLDLWNASVLLQCAIEVLFLSLTGRLHWNAYKANTLPAHVRRMFYVLYSISTMLLVRSVFRAAQGFQGKQCWLEGVCGASLKYEWFFWVFEVANITLFVIGVTVFPPGRYLPRSDHVFLDRHDATTERKGPGFSAKDPRPWIVTVMDPTNIYGMIRGTDKDTTMVSFWDEEHPVFDGEGDARRQYRKRKEEDGTPLDANRPTA
ncbi:hypothetical protein ANO11243_043840 [Dothideomycetidae sp. 11243]|nr:hypothetical protein ANO11243_043840 [fungal sp. No.11243]